MNQLLSVTETPIGAADFVASCGTIVATFDRSQDSGNVSWIVATETGEFFAKSAGTTTPVAAGRAVPYFDHSGRVRLLRNAVEVAVSCDHRSLARLRNFVETSDGPLLVYDRAPGELIGTPRDDGCLIVDFSSDRLTLIDLDTFVRGPFVNTMGRMFGSDRYMAPEGPRLAQAGQRSRLPLRATQQQIAGSCGPAAAIAASQRQHHQLGDAMTWRRIRAGPWWLRQG